MKEVFALLAAVLAIIGNIPYIIDIFRGRVRPHAYTWFVWTLVTGIVLFGQIAKGAGVGALPTAAAGFFTLLIFFLSLRNGFDHIKKVDTLFLIAALLGVIPWLLTDDPTISIVIAVAIDVIAFAPTLRKTWTKPSTESPILYGSNVVRHILALMALESYNPATMLHSIAMLVTNSAMTAMTLRPQKDGEVER